MTDLLDLKPPKEVDRAAARTLHVRGIVILEHAFEAKVIRSLRRVLKSVSGNFGALVSAATPGEPVASFDDLAAINSGWATEVEEELIPRLLDTFAAGAQNTSLSVAGVIDIPEFVHTQSVGWMADASNRLARVSDDAWQAVRSELTVGLTEGESIDQLQRRIRSTIDTVESRARTIARTEVIGAVNAGSYYEAKGMGVETKSWLATEDKRTRPTHSGVDGDSVGMDELFQVGAALLRFPHDPGGPSGETVNCRCTLLYDHHDLCMCVPGWAQSETGEQLVAAASSSCGCSGDTAIADPIEADSEGGFNPIQHRNANGSFNAAKARKWGSDEWSDWESDLVGKERQSVRAYTSSDSYIGMNARLRGLEPTAAEVKKAAVFDRHVANLDSALARPSATVPADVQAYRSMAGSMGKKLNEAYERGALMGSERGARFVDRGFVSTTLDQGTFHTAGDWKNSPISERVVLNINLRRGQKGAYVGGLSTHPREAEIILPRGTRFEVVGAERQGAKGVLHLTVEVVDE